MAFTNLWFLLLFLPFCLTVYYLTPHRFKNAVLLGCSLLLLLLWQPQYLPFCLGSLLLDYAASRAILRFGKAAGWVFPAVLLKDILLLFFLSVAVPEWGWETPLGLMVCCTTALCYLADCRSGRVETPATPVEFLLFCCFFGKLPLGPVVTWSEFSPQLTARRPSLSGMAEGMNLLLAGLAKLVVLAQPAYALWRQINSLPDYQVTTLSAWALLFSFFFAVYFFLSGCSDAACGLGLLFSLQLPVNFDDPLRAETVGGFLESANATVTATLRRYVLQPLGGPEGLAGAVNLLLFGMLSGMWFGLRIGTVLWGVFLAAFLLLEHHLPHSWQQRVPHLLRRWYVLAVVFFSHLLLMTDSLSGCWFALRKLFERSPGLLANDPIRYLLSGSWSTLLLCLFFCGRLPNRFCALISFAFPRIAAAARALLCPVLLSVVLFFVVGA